jgi:hypothetical protein
LSELLRWLLAMLIGAVISWIVCMWYHGLLFTTATAQTSVNKGIEADRTIRSSQTRVTASLERTQEVIDTVEVAPFCPPGQGAISDEWASKMREAYR